REVGKKDAGRPSTGRPALSFSRLLVLSGHCGFENRRIELFLRHLAAREIDILVPEHAGTGGNQMSNDDVLLETDEVVARTADRRIGQHARRLLERSGADEALRSERRLGDPEE